MYTTRNFQTKKAFREAVAAGERISIYQPNSDVTGHEAPRDGTVYLEGPHYPQPHKWYAQAELSGGFVVKVK